MNIIKKLLLSVFFFTSCTELFSQDYDLNFIFVINENVNPSISSIKLKRKLENKFIKEYSLLYSPGSLKIDSLSFNEITSMQENYNYTLSVSYNEVCKDDINYYHFDIEDFKIGWLNNYYFIMYVYNTNKKEYKKYYNPIKDRDFTYEYDSPDGSMRRVKRR